MFFFWFKLRFDSTVCLRSTFLFSENGNDFLFINMRLSHFFLSFLSAGRTQKIIGRSPGHPRPHPPPGPPRYTSSRDKTILTLSVQENMPGPQWNVCPSWQTGIQVRTTFIPFLRRIVDNFFLAFMTLHMSIFL